MSTPAKILMILKSSIKAMVAAFFLVNPAIHASPTDELLKILRPILGLRVSTNYLDRLILEKRIHDMSCHVVREEGSLVITEADALANNTTVFHVYVAIKSAIDRLDIFTDETQVYLPGKTLHKDDIVAVSTPLIDGIIGTSLEDVAEYSELDTTDGGKFFRVVLSTR